MFPQARGRIVSAFVGLDNLVDGIVPVFLGLLVALEFGSGLDIKRESHEDSVEPHLISIDSLMPEYTFLGSGLFLQLLEEGFHALENAGLLIKIVQIDEEMAGTAVVEVELVVLVAGHITVG